MQGVHECPIAWMGACDLMALSLPEIRHFEVHSWRTTGKKVSLEKFFRKEFPLKKTFEGVGRRGFENLKG